MCRVMQERNDAFHRQLILYKCYLGLIYEMCLLICSSHCSGYTVVNKTCCIICICVYTCTCHLINLYCFCVYLQFYLQSSIDWVMQKTRCVENQDENLFRKKKNVKTLHIMTHSFWASNVHVNNAFSLASG